MAHRATVQLRRGAFEYEILRMDYEFNQNLNLGPFNINWDANINIPRRTWGLDLRLGASTDVRGGNINLTIATPPDTDTTFHRWMFSRWRERDGTIRIDMDSINDVPRTLHIRFTNGHCTRLRDNFNSQNGEIMTTEITISCQRIEIGTNKPAVWPEFF